MTLLVVGRRRGGTEYPLPASATAAPWNSSTTPCAIPTYDGSGATIHPAVVDMGNGGWNGYRWWMANTPYPGQNDDNENPCIYGSNDRRTWTAPAGLTNPIDPDPGTPWFHSDTELVWNPETSRLVCLYRLASAATNPPTIYLRAQSSPDGVTWTDHGTIHTLPGSGARLSPAVERIAAGEWRMWVWGGGSAAQMLAATNPLGPWTVAGSLTLAGSAFTAAWHGDVIRHGGTYYAIYSDTISSGNLWLTTSMDGIAWSARVLVIDGGAGGGWDVTPYRPCLLPSTEPGFFDCWYSAYGSVTGGCGTDYVRLPIFLWPAT